MIRMNKNMLFRLRGLSSSPMPLHDDLLAIARAGFIELDGCIFLNAFAGRFGALAPDHFPDKTGIECFVNSFHVDDYVPGEFLEQSLLFSDEVSSMWTNQFQNIPALILVSAVNDGVVLKLHTLRAGEEWLVHDLDTYSEGVLEWKIGFELEMVINVE